MNVSFETLLTKAWVCRADEKVALELSAKLCITSTLNCEPDFRSLFLSVKGIPSTWFRFHITKPELEIQEKHFNIAKVFWSLATLEKLVQRKKHVTKNN